MDSLNNKDETEEHIYFHSTKSRTELYNDNTHEVNFREWFFEKTKDYPYENNIHKEALFKYVCFMIFDSDKQIPSNKEIPNKYCDSGVYKYIENAMEELIMEQTL